MIKCPVCASDISDIEERCPTCRHDAGPPNVRIASQFEEVQALEDRYQSALRLAEANGCLSLVEEFEREVKRSSAVINVDLDFLLLFSRDPRGLYASYERGVEGGMRRPAAPINDQERRAVGALVFGGHSREIIYAALSLDGSGPHSYGPYALNLWDVAIRSRATVLERNSYDFVKQHDLKPGVGRPPGYLATWENRHKLAVAKLAQFITLATQASDFPKLLLSSTGDRTTDEFIEVHIYGTFNLNAVESVKGSSAAARGGERALLRMTKDRLKNAGKAWIEG